MVRDYHFKLKNTFKMYRNCYNIISYITSCVFYLKIYNNNLFKIFIICVRMILLNSVLFSKLWSNGKN